MLHLLLLNLLHLPMHPLYLILLPLHIPQRISYPPLLLLHLQIPVLHDVRLLINPIMNVFSRALYNLNRLLRDRI